MKIFEEKLLRLKQAVKLNEDQEIAALLGMSKAAFADRKKRDAFPEEKLWALAQKRPDLGIDVLGVLTHLSSAGHAKTAISRRAVELVPEAATDFKSIKKAILRNEEAMTVAQLSEDERILLDNYRNSPPEARAALKATSAAFAGARPRRKAA